MTRLKQKTDISLEEAIAREKDPLALRTLNYAHVMKQLLDQAKTDPGFTADSWGPLAAFVDVATFKRVGTFLEVVDWTQYAQLLTDWAKVADWRPRFRRITARDGVVFLELAETTTYIGKGDKVEAICSCSVYEFDADDKLCHLDVHMQREMVAFPSQTWEVAPA